MLAAGLDGIDKEYELPPPTEQNVSDLTTAERKEAGIEMLPQDLSQAIEIAEGSVLLRSSLGDQVLDKFIENIFGLISSRSISWGRLWSPLALYP